MRIRNTVEILSREAIRRFKDEAAADLMAAYDKDENGRLDENEFGELRVGRSFLPPMASLDKDGDSTVSIRELTTRDSNGRSSAVLDSPVLDWATKQIAKYDSNADGKLSAQEVEKMVIKPKGADADGDGFITVEEYARFRAKK